jgi:hypothetical protein
MPDSWFVNQDYNIVRVRAYAPAHTNLKLFAPNPDNPNGHKDKIGGVGQFRFAWVPRDDEITENQMQQYGADATFGENFTFGNEPRGKIP